MPKNINWFFLSFGLLDLFYYIGGVVWPFIFGVDMPFPQDGVGMVLLWLFVVATYLTPFWVAYMMLKHAIKGVSFAIIAGTFGLIIAALELIAYAAGDGISWSNSFAFFTFACLIAGGMGVSRLAFTGSYRIAKAVPA